MYTHTYVSHDSISFICLTWLYRMWENGCTHIHAYTYTHTHIPRGKLQEICAWFVDVEAYLYTHTHIHTYTHTHIHTYTHTKEGVAWSSCVFFGCRSIFVHLYTHTRIHTYTHTHVQSKALHEVRAWFVDVRECTYTYTRTLIDPHPRVHTYTYTHIRTYTNIHTSVEACVYAKCMYVIFFHIYIHTSIIHTHSRTHIYMHTRVEECTGWRRLIGSPKLQIIFHKRATKYRSLLWKTTYKDKGSYESSPPCSVWCILCMWYSVVR